MNVYKITKTLYVIERGGEFMQGTESEALRMIKKCDVKEDFITEMRQNFAQGHNHANFGVYGTLIFSRKLDDVELIMPHKGVA